MLLFKVFILRLETVKNKFTTIAHIIQLSKYVQIVNAESSPIGDFRAKTFQITRDTQQLFLLFRNTRLPYYIIVWHTVA